MKQQIYQRSDISDQGVEEKKCKSERVQECKSERMQEVGVLLVVATIPPLRGPTRQNAARQRKSGRFGRDDKTKGNLRRVHREQREEKSETRKAKRKIPRTNDQRT